MIDEMKMYPLKNKRSIEEFNFFTGQNKDIARNGDYSNQKYTRILEAYDSKYLGLRN